MRWQSAQPVEVPPSFTLLATLAQVTPRPITSDLLPATAQGRPRADAQWARLDTYARAWATPEEGRYVAAYEDLIAWCNTAVANWQRFPLSLEALR